VEDYVKAAYELQQIRDTVATTDLARHVGTSTAAATKMLKHLASLGLMEHAPYQGARLTQKGERVALEIIRHHRLIELYLHDQLGYSWDEVHGEAEILEHHISETLEDRLCKLLGNPTIDPHGDPIPARDGTIEPRRGKPLSDFEVGEVLIVRRVNDKQPEVLKYLSGVGITLGTQMVVLDKQPFNGPLTLALAGHQYSIGRELAGHVFAETSIPEIGRELAGHAFAETVVPKIESDL
jgi:DtxR family Mn-dependent transcriptional regulator